MKKLISYLGSFLALLSLLFLGLKISYHADEIPAFQWGTGAVLALAGGVGYFVLATFILSFAWVLILRSGGVVLAWKDGFVILGKAQIAKYIPGNIFQFVNRVVIGKGYGISPEPILLSMGIETILVILSAGFISVLGISISNLQLPWLSEQIAGKFSSGFLLAVIFFIIILSNVLLSSKRAKIWVRERLNFLHPKGIGTALLIDCSVFICNGVIIVLLLSGLLNIQTGLNWFQFSWGFALAWVLGFIVPGAPGGIGIREAVFIGLFGKDLGEGVAAGLAVLIRVITSISDIATFGLAFWMGRNKSAQL